MNEACDEMPLLCRAAPFDVELESGLAVRLRPVVAEDSARIDAAYELLSEESRRNRFWAAPRSLSSARKRELTRADEWDHLAWIALRPDDESYPGFAGASYWRDPLEPGRAEISFTVADAWQRAGLGTLLFSVLWHEGWSLGVRQFHGVCRLGNFAMREWWRGIGGEVRPTRHHCELDFPLESPESFRGRVAYEMPPMSRRVEVAEWLERWSEIAK